MKKFKFLLLTLISILVLSYLIKRISLVYEVENYNYGLVTKVYDGDTIQVKFPNGKKEIIRFIGVNCPELDDDREIVKVFAKIASRFTFVNLYNKKVKLAYDWELRDQYGRTLAYIWLDSTLFNELIIRKGFAYAFLKYPFKKEFQIKFKDAEREARRRGTGLWGIERAKIISSDETFFNINEYRRVKFKCANIYFGKKYIFLNSSRDYKRSFSVLIPLNEKNKFGNINQLKNKTLLGEGLIEKYKNKTQMIIFSPIQLKIINNHS